VNINTRVSRFDLLSLLACMSMLLLPGNSQAQTSAAGDVRYIRVTDGAFDRFTNAPSATQQAWMRDHYSRMTVFSPYWDTKLSWYPNARTYVNLYAIPKTSSLLTQHPEWILKDRSGNRLFVPWECAGGTCPQYAGDLSNPGFRRWWIDQVKIILNKGYRGIWIDDVNMQFRVGNGNGTEVPPYDPNTGTDMTWTNWRKYVAEFVEQIRNELPGKEIVHNSIWFAGPAGVRDQDPYIQRQIAAASIINLERGIDDTGLTNGTGEWSVNALLAFVDRVHAKGRSVIVQGYSVPNREYGLAAYFLINNGVDEIAEFNSTPDNWYSGYEVALGAPLGARYYWNGLLRRDFQLGMVLLNEPSSPTRSVSLPSTFRTIGGANVTSVSIPASSGLVLTSGSAPVAPPPSTSGMPLSDMSWISASNGWGPVEKDRSNGEQGATDGRAMRINGVSYTKGLGVHANSTIRYNLGGVCSTFTARAGVDDEVPRNIGSVIFQVFADGTKLYESGVLRSGSPVQSINVSVTGRRELVLTVSGTTDGIGNDHADWADPRLTCSSVPSGTLTSSYLSDRATTYVVNGFGPAEKDRSNGEQAAGDGRTLTLGGATFAKGLGVHANSEIRYNLAGACTGFSAVVGIDDEVARGAGSAIFQVWSDGAKLWESPIMRSGDARRTVDVDLTGRTALSLIVNGTGDGIGRDHADWADAKVVCSR
jgi:hypothetical protein